MIVAVGLSDSSDVSLARFGEVTNARQRAKMVDVGLEILVGLWSEQPFHFDGEYYHVQEVTFLPRPLQSPRIPTWWVEYRVRRIRKNAFPNCSWFFTGRSR